MKQTNKGLALDDGIELITSPETARPTIWQQTSPPADPVWRPPWSDHGPFRVGATNRFSIERE